MKLHLQPAQPDLVVRCPITRQPLPAEGDLVDDTTYWQRRLAEGDVKPVQSAQSETTAQPKGKK
jgi:hypothetical protein